jgi:ABC-2 type transport system ATP-binding protein
MGVIEIEGLHKEYRRLRGGRVAALAGLDLSVPEGGVFGFLGPNGSGKTTTIRCLVGLTRPTRGSCRLFGAPTPERLTDVIGQVGSVVETPALYPTFSGRKNLRLLGALEGIGPRAVDAMLVRVGLAERARDPVKNYSLGMKQRLGIAAALLKDPALLILDEPANGLDPGGIREIRELIRSLGAEGRTVFVSSHLLSEVQQTCDQVAILGAGRRITQGPVDEVLQATQRAALHVVVADVEGARAALAEAGIPAERNGGALRVPVPVGQAAHVNETLGRRGIWASEIRPEEISLEDVFLELTATEPAPGAAP